MRNQFEFSSVTINLNSPPQCGILSPSNYETLIIGETFCKIEVFDVSEITDAQYTKTLSILLEDPKFMKNLPENQKSIRRIGILEDSEAPSIDKCQKMVLAVGYQFRA